MKNNNFLELSKKTGVNTVKSGIWDPPNYGSFVKKISPGLIFMSYFNKLYTQIDIAPKWTGIWGAFTSNFPLLVKIAHEKSNLSFMLTENDFLYKVTPIYIAMLVKWLL